MSIFDGIFGGLFGCGYAPIGTEERLRQEQERIAREWAITRQRDRGLKWLEGVEWTPEQLALMRRTDLLREAAKRLEEISGPDECVSGDLIARIRVEVGPK